ncbi:MAG: hypothetical protein KAJ39_04985 [Gammaproteobacteria bacterium]|nr:hypothetical protein [Gammaproteobacteria bacterium]
MPLRLTQLEKDRLDVLNSGHGNRFGKGIYTTRPNKVKITVEQVIEVKRCFAAGMHQTTIMNKTGLSEWITNGVKNGRYDFVVKAQK